MKLNVGCRDDLREGYENIDFFHTASGVIHADAVELQGYTVNSIEEIYAKDFIEHISFDQVDRALTRWHELLNPGGELIIETPDMDWLLGVEYKNKPHSVLRRLFGPQDDEGQYHRTGWNESFLTEWLSTHGFHSIKRMEDINPGNLKIVCSK